MKSQAACQRRYRLRIKKIESDRTTKRHFPREISAAIPGKCSFCQADVNAVATLSGDGRQFLSLRKKEREISEKKVKS